MYTSFDKIVCEDDLISKLGIANCEQIDVAKVVSNIKKNMPFYDTLLNVTELKEPTDVKSLLEFSSDLKLNLDTDFRAPYIGKVREINSKDAVALVNANPEIETYMMDKLTSGESISYIEEGTLERADIDSRDNIFKMCAYFYFVENACNDIRLMSLDEVFAYSINDEHKQEETLENRKTITR